MSFPRLFSPVGRPSGDLNLGHRPPRLGDVVGISTPLCGRRRAVPLATGVKIRPVVLSGSSPLTHVKVDVRTSNTFTFTRRIRRAHVNHVVDVRTWSEKKSAA